MIVKKYAPWRIVELCDDCPSIGRIMGDNNDGRSRQSRFDGSAEHGEVSFARQQNSWPAVLSSRWHYKTHWALDWNKNIPRITGPEFISSGKVSQKLASEEKHFHQMVQISK